MYGLAMDYVVCVSVPYGNTEGPVGYTSVRRLQHVHVWMRVDVCAEKSPLLRSSLGLLVSYRHAS